MSYVKRLGIILLVLLLCVCCDQATKYTAKELLHPYLPVSFFNDAVRLQYAENKGVFLSLGASLPEETRFWVFTVAVSLALLGLFTYVVVRFRKMKFSNALALTLIVAGSISNVIDRMLNNGRVVDFLNIGIGSLRTGIFNIADVAITVGVCLVVLNGLFCFLLPCVAAFADQTGEEAAILASEAWLALVDEGKYSESWDEAATYFRNAVSKENWQKSLTAYRKPLGNVLSREVIVKKYTKSSPGAPDGEYVVIQYKTSFEHNASAIETVTPMLEKDENWRVSGYYIR